MRPSAWPTPFLSRLNFTPRSSASSPARFRGMGNEGCGQSLTFHLCCSLLLKFFCCSSMGSLPWETVLHALLQHGCFPQAVVLQERTALVWVPHGGQFLPENLLQCGLPSTGCRSCQEPPPVWAPHGLQLPSGHIHLLKHGVLHGLQVDIFSTVVLHGLQGDSLPHHGLLQRLQGNLVPGAPHSLLLHRPWCLQSCFLHVFSLLPPSCWTAVFTLSITQAEPVCPTGSALASSRSVFEPTGTGSVWHGGSSWCLLTEATSAAPRYQNLAM